MYKGKWGLMCIRLNGVDIYKGKLRLTCKRVKGG